MGAVEEERSRPIARFFVAGKSQASQNDVQVLCLSITSPSGCSDTENIAVLENNAAFARQSSLGVFADQDVLSS